MPFDEATGVINGTLADFAILVEQLLDGTDLDEARDLALKMSKAIRTGTPKTTATLAVYLLAGWILTDKTCWKEEQQ